MESITIRITEATEGGYMYDIWTRDAIESDADIADNGSDDGGLCTTTLRNALGMAVMQAEEIIKREKGNECAGCGIDINPAKGIPSNFSGTIMLCSACHTLEEEEGDFIGER